MYQEEAESQSARWVNEVDRGGLWHVQQCMFMLFAAMEEEVRANFRVGAIYKRCMQAMTKSYFTGAC